MFMFKMEVYGHNWNLFILSGDLILFARPKPMHISNNSGMRVWTVGRQVGPQLWIMIRTTVACGAVTTLAGVAGLLIREYIVYKGLFQGQKVFEKNSLNLPGPIRTVYLSINLINNFRTPHTNLLVLCIPNFDRFWRIYPSCSCPQPNLSWTSRYNCTKEFCPDFIDNLLWSEFHVSFCATAKDRQ